MKSSSPFFHPWVGPNYSFGGIFGKRIMVLGDSHYCGTPCGKCGINPNPQCNRLTSDVIGWCLDPNCEREVWMKTYLKFERSLVGHETTSEESRKIWDSIVFYNFLQVALYGPREAGTPEQYQASVGPFFNVLNIYQPDLLIVWGKRLWGNLPGENWIDGSDVLVDGYQVENGYYLLDNGKKVRAICVCHPSVGYSWDFWYKVIVSSYKGL